MASYYDAAFEILDRQGTSGLTASAVCEHMAITRGAFYHHFDNFDEFVDGLLCHWELQYSHELINESVHIGDLRVMLKREAEMASTLRHGAEVALRAWSATDSRVARAQRRVDRIRYDGLRSAFEGHGIPAGRSATYADLALATLIGAQMRRLSGERIRTIFEEFSELVLGAAQHRDAVETA
ncbi:hypothetical protein AU194_15950 [Mycobacterium sp. GA-2829]|nr:hypothetical protein AU194_15950 [Mycobacterium sp. GA-2829]